jgi:hypothetical protein
LPATARIHRWARRRGGLATRGGLGLLLSWKRHKVIGAKVARFRQIDMNKPYVHHDALEFPDGQCVLVSRLKVGQRATVLQLPASARERAQERDSVSVVEPIV